MLSKAWVMPVVCLELVGFPMAELSACVVFQGFSLQELVLGLSRMAKLTVCLSC